MSSYIFAHSELAGWCEMSKALLLARSPKTAHRVLRFSVLTTSGFSDAMLKRQETAMLTNYYFHKYLYALLRASNGINYRFCVSHTMAVQNLDLDLSDVFRRIRRIAQKYWYTPVKYHHELKG